MRRVVPKNRPAAQSTRVNVERDEPTAARQQRSGESGSRRCRERNGQTDGVSVCVKRERVREREKREAERMRTLACMIQQLADSSGRGPVFMYRLM